MLDPMSILTEYYDPGSLAYRLLVVHGKLVGDFALEAAKAVSHLDPDLDFIRKAAMLHDIGIFHTHAPKLGCSGDRPYICHGFLGRELLEEKGLTRLALVCERHIGVGISAQDIRANHLPLPERDMVPVSLEEQIISYADKFFSKTGPSGSHPKSISDIKASLLPFGAEKVAQFERWVHRFNPKEAGKSSGGRKDVA
jgi:uncharacterized protein